MPVLGIVDRPPSSSSVIGAEAQPAHSGQEFVMGFLCLGCCWMLMALLFVGGMMSIAWIDAIALFVLLEKTVPWGDRMSRLGGVLLFVWGVIGLVRMI